jgi:hypothetical protein
VAANPPVTRTKREGLRWRLAIIAFEIWPVVVVVFGGLIAIGKLSQSAWEGTFLYNGDSLVLPLIEDSILRGEPLHWVFSSQNFFFPEGLFFFLSTLFTDSPRVALYTNAVLNLVALYVVLRIIARQLAHRSRHRFVEITIALGATVLFLVFVLLEPTASVNRSGTATTYLMTTYYYGVIITGLVVVSLTLWVTRSFAAEFDRRRVLIYWGVVGLLTTLVVFSDPLYLAQVLAPMAVGLLVLIWARRLSWRNAWILVAPGLVGSVLAFGLRYVFRGLFASELDSYVQLSQIPTAIHILYESLLEMSGSAQGSLKLIIITGVMLLTFSIMAFAIYSRFDKKAALKISTVEYFIVTFVSVSSVSLLVGHVITGAITTRYLTPLYVFPLLTVVFVGVYVLRRLLVEVESAELRRNLSRFSLGVAAAASVLIVIVGIINIPPVARSVSGVGYTTADCFDEFVGDSDVNGVGSFWTVRQLDLYGSAEGDILQADAELGVYDWLNNVGAYDDKTFSYVIVDETGLVPRESLAVLGDPAEIVVCSGYEIWDYAGTEGEDILTDRIAESADILLDE